MLGLCENISEPFGYLKQGIFFPEKDTYKVFKKCIFYKWKGFFHEDEGSKFLHNIRNHPPCYTEHS